MNWPDSFEGGRLGDGRPATATEHPGSIDELRHVVTGRVAEGLALYPQGGGTSLDFGGTPRSPGVAIDTRALSRVIDYPAADMTVTVEAGITMAALRDRLAAENQRLLIEAPDPDRATLGAVFATNTCGPRRFGAGRPRDQVLGVAFVTADGALVRGGGRVVKNVAGYDFPRLLTGSLGTLGVLAEMTLKVRPRPEAAAVVVAPLQNAEALGIALDALNTSCTRPMAVEALNTPGAKLAGIEAGTNSDGWVLVVGFEDNAASVAWQVGRLMSELGPSASVIEGTDAESIFSALTAFQALVCGSVAFVANVRPSATTRFAALLGAERWAVQIHAGNGIVRALRRDSPDIESLAAEIDRLRAEAVREGGNLILSRCPVDWKPRLKVWGEPRADWAICERIKDAFDPRGVMNPGRFVGRI